jgi:exopolyphosphatase / guanosine-5'-triphosphate,3'-diphosphate pyrophosphatase
MRETSPIVPRWEWRTFGGSLDAVEAELGRWDDAGGSESDEEYLLSAEADNVKIRDALLDIKVLREVDHEGLERWEPTLKASFPLDASTLATVFEALRHPLPELSRLAYSQDQLLSELIEPIDTIRVTLVHKRRVRYTLRECMAELSHLEVDGRPIRTLALESIDPASVVAQVAALGLQDRVNTSVPRALLTF